MQVQFKNALFGLDTYDFAVVRDQSLIIVLKTREIELEFDSHEEALDAQAELGQVISAAKENTFSVTELMEEAATVVSSVFGGLVGSFKAKATKASSSVETRAAKVVADLEEVLNAVARSQGDMNTKPSTTAKDSADAESVFGTTRSARNTSVADTQVSELSDSALRVAISDKADYLIDNDARVKALVAQLRTFHSDDQIDDVIQDHKDQIFRIARANDHLTVNEVFAELLRSM